MSDLPVKNEMSAIASDSREAIELDMKLLSLRVRLMKLGQWLPLPGETIEEEWRKVRAKLQELEQRVSAIKNTPVYTAGANA